MNFADTLGSFISIALGVLYVFVIQPDIDTNFPLSNLGTKTAYRHCGLESFIDPKHERLGRCHAVFVEALFRHGTRAPATKHVTAIKELKKRITDCEGSELPTNFRFHPISFEDADSKQLLPRGLQELYQLGQSFRKRFKKHFKFTRSNSQFYSSSSERARFSARSFYNGLFSLPELSNKSKADWKEGEPIHTKDALLRFFDFCDRYNDQMERNKSIVLKEYKKFQRGPEIRRVIEEIVSKHRIDCANLSADDLYFMHLACAHEVAAGSDETLSPWCEFFTPYHVDVLEYLLDLKHFWKKSYAYELNYVQACPLVSEMIDQLRIAAHNFIREEYDQLSKKLVRGSFWFGHAETIIPVVAALGLFNDSVNPNSSGKLHAEDFSERLKRLKLNPSSPTMFRAGHIAPFAGNLAFVLHYCPDAVAVMESNDPLNGFFVEPLVNEKNVAWPIGGSVQPPTVASPGASFAPLSTVLMHFRKCLPGIYEDQKTCSLHHH
ncbi:unnamed protein product [Calicophoron daubneyi]|uniref:Multiple inositol polyphosphate phosphatase 1 n=1 Tax=Calicophoron daubneyi TaxID=300641 RepID=A0AAV2T9D0_CALDB